MGNIFVMYVFESIKQLIHILLSNWFEYFDIEFGKSGFVLYCLLDQILQVVLYILKHYILD
jgi:hypothetical protein